MARWYREIPQTEEQDEKHGALGVTNPLWRNWRWVIVVALACFGLLSLISLIAIGLVKLSLNFRETQAFFPEHSKTS